MQVFTESGSDFRARSSSVGFVLTNVRLDMHNTRRVNEVSSRSQPLGASLSAQRPECIGRNCIRTRSAAANGVLGLRSVFLPPDQLPHEDKYGEDLLLPPKVRHDPFDRTRDIRAYHPIAGLDLETPQEMNEHYRATGLERHRYVLHPDEQFGAIVRYDAVLEDTLPLQKLSWEIVAKEGNFTPPDDIDLERSLTMPVEQAIQRVMRWTRDWLDIKKIAKRKAQAYLEVWRSSNHTLRPGQLEWLRRMKSAGIPICLCSSVDNSSLQLALGQMNVTDIFQEFVTAEDDFETRAQMFLHAAKKLKRPPQLCAVFDNDPEGITAAHDISAKSVSVLGLYTAWELQASDLTASELDDLSTINVRRLFSEVRDQVELMLQPELEKETEKKKDPWGFYDDPNDNFVYVRRRR